MSANQPDRRKVSQELTDDEMAIIAFCRILGLDREEALKRLSIPSSSLVHLCAQELAANLSIADEFSLSGADPIALSGHDDPD